MGVRAGVAAGALAAADGGDSGRRSAVFTTDGASTGGSGAATTGASVLGGAAAGASLTAAIGAGRVNQMNPPAAAPITATTPSSFVALRPGTGSVLPHED